jgi:hypothetical protein
MKVFHHTDTETQRKAFFFFLGFSLCLGVSVVKDFCLEAAC